METMGRDAGWLAASACLSGVVDLLVLPEEVFDKEKLSEYADYVIKRYQRYSSRWILDREN